MAVQRRLAAILAADVAGYSRLMGEDEEGTRDRFNAHLAELIKPAIASRRGRIVKTTGDALLIEFASVVDAVQCAVDIQKGMADRNADEPDNRRIEFRVGVNLGDVIIEGDDIHGDGVNVAARLEALADPGGICLSGDVFRQCRGKIDIGFEDLGEREVKNIAEQVRCYRVMLDPDAAGKFIEAPTREIRDKPSLAVLPFVNMSDDPEQEYFSDGITEDIITDLSNVSALFVISRNSTFAYKGQSPDIRKVGQELGVRHVLEGSVRKAGDNVRINAQLIDASSGGHVWAERYDAKLEDVFTLQDQIAAKIVSALEVSLTPADRAQIGHKLTTNAQAYDYYLEGRKRFYGRSPESMVSSKRSFERALQFDPEFAAAYSFLSLIQLAGTVFQWSGNTGGLEAALSLAEKAITIDEGLSIAHTRLAWVKMFLHEYGDAVTHCERAIELDPGEVEAFVFFAEILNYAGEPDRAIEMAVKAVEIDPFAPPNLSVHLGHAYYLLRRYDEADSEFRAALSRMPHFPPAHLHLAVNTAEAGKPDQARTEMELVRKMLPGYTVSFVDGLWRHKREDHRLRFAEALRVAGLPE